MITPDLGICHHDREVVRSNWRWLHRDDKSKCNDTEPIAQIVHHYETSQEMEAA